MLPIAAGLKEKGWYSSPGLWVLSGVLPLAVVMLFFMGHFWTVACLLGVPLIFLMLNRHTIGLYLVVFGLPLFQSITLTADKASSIGLNLQYFIIPVVFISWLSAKVYDKEIATIRLPRILPLAMWLFILLLSIANQTDVVSSGFIQHSLFQVFALVNYLLLFFILVNEPLNKAGLFRIYWILLAIALVASVVGIYQYLHATPSLQSEVRVASTFTSILRKNVKNNPNAFGTYMAWMVMLPFVLWPVCKVKWRPALVVSVPILILSLLLTLSRSSLLAVVFATLLYVYNKKKRLALLVVFLSVVCLVGLYFEPTFHKRMGSILTVLTDKALVQQFMHINPQTLDWEYVGYFGMGGYNSDIVSAAFRVWAWIEGLRVFAVHPLLGTGYHLLSAYSYWPTAENLYIDFLAMTGLFGFAAFAVVQIVFIKDGLRLMRQSPQYASIALYWLVTLVILFFVSLTGSIWFNGKLLGMFWVLGGLFYNAREQTLHPVRQS